MSHQEKQEIFDRYADNKGYGDWEELLYEFSLGLKSEDEFMLDVFAACDLVQEEQQKRIAERVELKEIQCHIGTEYEVDKSTILNPENKIQ